MGKRKTKKIATYRRARGEFIVEERRENPQLCMPLHWRAERGDCAPHTHRTTVKDGKNLGNREKKKGTTGPLTAIHRRPQRDRRYKIYIWVAVSVRKKKRSKNKLEK